VNTLITIIGAALAVIISTPAFSAGNGSSPKGMPFQNLQQQIYDIAGYAESLSAQQALFFAAISDLEGEVAMLSGAIQSNIGNIATMQEDLNSAQAKIGTLEGAVSTLDEQINLKQALISESCPDGAAVRAIYPDGSIACESVGTSTVPGTLKSFFIVKGRLLPIGSGEGFSIACPVNTVVTGGGYQGFDVDTYASRPSSGNRWYLATRNTNPYYERTVYVYATCSYIQ